MITPKPATILALYQGHPERWTKFASDKKVVEVKDRYAEEAPRK